MALRREPPEKPGVVELVHQMADGLGRLVTEHVTLVKLELVAEARAFATAAARILAFLPFLLVGYLLWCGALSYVLARYVEWGWALFIVGTLNVGVAGWGLFTSLSKLQRQQPLLESSLAEMKTTAAALAHPEQATHVEVYRGE